MHQKYHQVLSVSEEKIKSMTELSRCYYTNYTLRICYKFSSTLPNSVIGVQSYALLGGSQENTRQSNLKLFWSHSQLPGELLSISVLFLLYVQECIMNSYHASPHLGKETPGYRLHSPTCLPRLTKLGSSQGKLPSVRRLSQLLTYDDT